MIPKRAIFYWEGPEMSWLRKQSIETFKRLNPSWTVGVIDGAGIPIQGESRLAVVNRSDWARYRALLEGGVYFDSDIVFCKPIPDEWLESEMIIPFAEHDVFAHVALIGCEPGNRWAEMMDKACQVIVSGRNVLGYQTLGVILANRCGEAARGYKTTWVEQSSLLPIDWNHADRLWVDGELLSPMVFGVHWFGGDWTSIDMEAKVDVAWALTSKSIVAKAWRRGMGYGADRAALLEQHGIA